MGSDCGLRRLEELVDDRSVRLDRGALHVEAQATLAAELLAAARAPGATVDARREHDAGGDRRAWRWMVEGDADAHSYDHAGEKASIWAFLRLSLERGAPADGERGEDIDLNGFGFRVWRADEVA